MQDKMATAGPVKLKLYQWFFQFWFPLFLFLVRFPRLIRWIAAFFMRCFCWAKPDYLRAIVSNYRVIFPDKSESELQTMAHRMMDNHSRYWIEFFRYARREDILEKCLEDPAAAVKSTEKVLSNPSAILLTAHMGNWELGGVFMSRLGCKANVVYVKDRFDIVERFRSKFRSFGDVNEIPISHGMFAALPALRALDSGEYLAMQGDRDFNDRGIPATFFGRECRFPQGPYVLSLVSGAPIIPSFVLYGKRSGTYRLLVYDPLVAPGNGTKREKIQSLLQQYLSVLESVILDYPEQWYTFYPFFQPELAEVSVGSASQGNLLV